MNPNQFLSSSPAGPDPGGVMGRDALMQALLKAQPQAQPQGMGLFGGGLTAEQGKQALMMAMMAAGGM